MHALAADCRTTDRPLTEVIARLATHSSVIGILFVGSTASEAMAPWSDIDLLLVFDPLPGPLRFVHTWIDRRLAEIYCTTRLAIERIAAMPSWPAGSEEAALVSWLQSGTIAFDRDESLLAVQSAARTIALEPPTDAAAYDAWRTIGYNVAQMNRYAAAPDPASRLAVAMRRLYGLADVMVHYFTIRGLRWTGEKSAIRYWEEHDPGFLDRFARCLAETDQERQVDCFADVARRATAPAGELWAYGTTTIGPGWGFATGATAGDVEAVGTALAAWDALVR